MVNFGSSSTIVFTEWDIISHQIPFWFVESELNSSLCITSGQDKQQLLTSIAVPTVLTKIWHDKATLGAVY